MSSVDTTRPVPAGETPGGAAADHLAWRYGPCWPHVLTVVEHVRIADADMLDHLADEWAAGRDAARDAAWDAAWAAAWAAGRDAAWAAAWAAGRDAARDAARAAARDAAWDAAWAAAWAAARDAAWDAARDAAWDAAWAAVAVHDLVGQYGYTAEHEAALIGPYAEVFGLPWGDQ